MELDNEVESFLTRINTLQDDNLQPALEPALAYEEDLRRLFASEKSHPKIANLHAGLIDVFAAPESIKKSRPRVVKDEHDLSAHYVFPLTPKQRKQDGAPCVVSDIDEFRKNWSIFTEGSLSQLLDWNNVVAAGGSVLACLAPLDKQHTVSKRAIRKHYHSTAYPSSDIDLFIYGLDAKQAEAKMQYIYEAVRDSIPWDTTCVRTKHTISIHSQYPYRAIQIVLRLYQSPAEVLAGFDVDAPCCAYDGQTVWANPRSVVAMMRQCNTIDMSRRSPSYEVRLAKYAARGFEVYVPILKREEVDPTIYERSIARMTGLARLLVLEKLTSTDTRNAFLDLRRDLRGRPSIDRYHQHSRKREFKGDLKADDTIAGLELNNYDVTTLHIPYGPNWNARRIDKLVYQTDLAMNSTFNPKNKNRRLHRHPAFFGTMEECLEDCCETCPEPIDDDENKLRETEEETYIRGRVSFIEENPGRQTISGSFNPIDNGEWAEQVYLMPTQKLFAAIAQQNREEVQKIITEEGFDLQQRDHVGRSPLHLAIVTKSSGIACDLVDAGARITARLVDGRTSVHLAAQYGDLLVMNKLFEKNAINVAEDEAKNPKPKEDEKDKDKILKDAKDSKVGEEKPSSEDDWSSQSDEDVDMIGADDDDSDDVGKGDLDLDDDDGDDDGGEGSDDENSDSEGDGDSDDDHEAPARSPTPPPADVLDDEDEPDIIDINQFDFDFGLTALGFAVIFGSIAVVDKLIEHGADIKLPTKAKNRGGTSVHPLTLTAFREDEDEACRVAEHLIKTGATSTTVSDDMVSILHALVSLNKAKVLGTVLQCDEKAKDMVNFPSISYQDYVFPVVTAIQKKHYASLAVLLSYGAKLDIDEKDVAEAQEVMPSSRVLMYGDDGYVEHLYQPIETALATAREAVPLLITLGASVDVGLKEALSKYSDSNERRTILEWVQVALNAVNVKAKEEAEQDEMDTEADTSGSNWKAFLAKLKKAQLKPPNDLQRARKKEEQEWKLKDIKETQQYLEDLVRLLKSRKAKSWKELYPEIESTASAEATRSRRFGTSFDSDKENKTGTYFYMTSDYVRRSVPNHLVERYDELYEACFNGDDDTVKKLCIPVDGESGNRPLKVSVRIDQRNKPYDDEGFTPLCAAIMGGKWTTSRLLLSIAASQYRPEDPKERRFKASKIKLDDSDSDASEDDDDDDDSDSNSDMTVDGKTTFIDIATQSSTVHSPIKPSDILTHRFYYEPKPTEQLTHTANLLEKAVVDGNTDVFSRIANLYQAISHPLEDLTSTGLLQMIVEHDRPEMLDLYIRRTGGGIDYKLAQKHSDTPPVPLALNDKNRHYLGLNVHGKKRSDLAKQHDPDATKTSAVGHEPLVWRAASTKSGHKILRYLASDKPIAAFRSFASAQADERAVWLNRVAGVSGAGLEKHLPVWLGWSTSRIGESPLTAAIVGSEDSLKTIELLLELQPQVMTPAFSAKIAAVNYNMLLLAARRGSKPKVVDLILSKSNSPTHTAREGWNIYHLLAKQGNLHLFDHLLSRLPKDVSENLLLQQTGVHKQTALHVAIEGEHVKFIKSLLTFSKSSLLARDTTGSTSLHDAIRKKNLDIFRLLSTFVTDPVAYFMEDSVGHTILDIVTWPELNERFSTASSALGRSWPAKLDLNKPALQGPWSTSGPKAVESWRRWEKDEAISLLREIKYTRGILDSVVLPEERKNRRTKLVWEFNKFIDKLDARAKQAVEVYKNKEAEWKEEEQKKEVDEDSDSDEEPVDPFGDEADEDLNEEGATRLRALLTAVRDTLDCYPDQKRQLIHVADVQHAVTTDLTKAMKSNQSAAAKKHRDNEGLADDDANEKDWEVTELKKSMVARYIDFDDDGDDCDCEI